MAAPDESAAPQHMNFDHLRHTTLGDRQFERDVLEQFMAEMPEQLASAESGLRAGDRATVGRAARSLNVSSRTVGAQTLGELMAEMEKLARAGQLEQARAALTRARAEFTELQRTLEDYLRDRAA
jgi:HPt (histidine-containing phosphotransfer) domain-containing protein